MYEPQCELVNNCDTDQLSFKAYLSRWMADTAQVAPYTHDAIMAKLRPTAEAAVSQCQGGTTGTYCGFHWTTGSYDGTTGVGQQMSVLEAVQGLLAAAVKGPLTSQTGGSSKGNPAAGGSGVTGTPVDLAPLTMGDRIGAAIVTVLLAGAILWALYFLLR